MSVQRLSIRPIADETARDVGQEREKVFTATQPAVGTMTSQEQAMAQRMQAMGQIQKTIYVLAAVAGARLLVLLALIGAFVLAYMAMEQQSSQGLAVLVAFALLVLAPLVWLYSRRPT